MSIDDLMQAGFFAMLKAAAAYDPNRGAAFSTVLVLWLKNAFAEEAGMRGKKNDALKYCESLDAPAMEWSESDATEGDFISDDAAALAFVNIEYQDFLKYAQCTIAAALDTLSPKQRALLTERYINGKTFEESAAIAGFSGKQAAHEAAERALNKLRCGRYSKYLRQCLNFFEEYRCYEDAAKGGNSGFYRYGISATEAAAILNIRR